MFQRLLVANRGAIARRIIRACNKLGIESVALYSDADSQAPYLAEATASIGLPGNTAAETYLNKPLLLQALLNSGADAVHPGYGFLAEDADFAQQVIELGVHFVGPAPKWLSSMGDKVAARELMAEHNFPLFAGSKELSSVAAAQAAATEIGYPVMLKPAAGGGGIGMQVVADDQGLAIAFDRCQRMALAAFGNGSVFVESWISPARHIEVQVLADEHGNVMHAFERDCSLQRRQQKVIEEAPAPLVDRESILALALRSVKLLETLGYNNVGTLETLQSPSGEFGFLEMNTRIQVEHGVTEMVTGLDLVAEQIQLAAGGQLPPQPTLSGYAVQARIYAEDSITSMPSTGRLQVFAPPSMRHVRVETGYAQGMAVTPYYDPLLAKVLAWAPTRELAIGRLAVALQAYDIRGVSTNVALLRRVLRSDEFLAGRVHTGLLQQFLG